METARSLSYRSTSSISLHVTFVWSAYFVLNEVNQMELGRIIWKIHEINAMLNQLIELDVYRLAVSKKQRCESIDYDDHLYLFLLINYFFY